MLGIFRLQAGPHIHDCSLLPCWVFSGCKLVLKSTTAMLNTFWSQSTTALCYHAGYFPAASWSSHPRLLSATMLGIFRLQAGPQIHDSHAEYVLVAIHDCSLLPCWVFSGCKLVLTSTTALCYHAGYFPAASWSSNPRQPC